MDDYEVGLRHGEGWLRAKLAADDAVIREEAIAEMKAAQALNADPEAAHGDADDVLCKLLKALGYDDVVAEYDLVHKWFA